MDLTAILLQVVAGAAGGNVGGMLNKAKSWGPLLNTILGAVGGLGGGQLIGPALGAGTAGSTGSAAVVGALLTIVAGFLKKKTT